MTSQHLITLHTANDTKTFDAGRDKAVAFKAWQRAIDEFQPWAAALNGPNGELIACWDPLMDED